MKDDTIDVVVPVYNNFSDARRLFEHLERATNRSPCRVLVVDDASSDTSPLELPRVGKHILDVRLIRNEVNRGFAASVNLAMRESRRDVILLNTDTLVFEGWIDRLRAAANSRDRIATVTPLSNAATILSYPTFPDEFKGTLEIDWQSIDQICARIGARPVAIPTGIGFCMLIRRACLEEIGVFDEAAFKDGYGEECDFCMRAASVGWSNMAAPDVFVWHRGEGSFKARAQDLRSRAQAVLAHRYPAYQGLIRDFIRSDPLRIARQEIDIARMLKGGHSRSLHLRPSPPTETANDRTAVYLERQSRMASGYRPTSEQFMPLPNLPIVSLFAPSSKIRHVLQRLQIVELVIYSGRLWFLLLTLRIRLEAWRLGISERTSAS